MQPDVDNAAASAPCDRLVKLVDDINQVMAMAVKEPSIPIYPFRPFNWKKLWTAEKKKEDHKDRKAIDKKYKPRKAAYDLFLESACAVELSRCCLTRAEEASVLRRGNGTLPIRVHLLPYGPFQIIAIRDVSNVQSGQVSPATSWDKD